MDRRPPAETVNLCFRLCLVLSQRACKRVLPSVVRVDFVRNYGLFDTSSPQGAQLEIQDLVVAPVVGTGPRRVPLRPHPKCPHASHDADRERCHGRSERKPPARTHTSPNKTSLRRTRLHRPATCKTMRKERQKPQTMLPPHN